MRLDHVGSECRRAVQLHRRRSRARQGNFNMASQKVRGVDVEATYRLSLSNSLPTRCRVPITIRVIGTRNLENFTDDGNPNTLDFETVGAAVPKYPPEQQVPELYGGPVHRRR